MCSRWFEFVCELVVRGAASASLWELACVRDLRVRGLVGVAAPGRDPLGSYIVEILRVSKAGM